MLWMRGSGRISRYVFLQNSCKERLRLAVAKQICPYKFGHFPPPLGAAQDGGHLAMVIRPSSINTISRPLKSLSLPYPIAIEQPERQRCFSVS